MSNVNIQLCETHFIKHAQRHSKKIWTNQNTKPIK